MLLANKTAIIYGAGGAIGGAVAQAFAREGARVFLTGRSLAGVSAVAKAIKDAGGMAEPAQLDGLDSYVERFNAGDFDGVRDMLAEEVRLELVSRTRMNGCGEVSNYLSNYSRTRDWLYSTGFVDRRPAVLVRDPAQPAGRPIYFVLLEWTGAKVATIRDFRYARYATDGAEFVDSSRGPSDT